MTGPLGAAPDPPAPVALLPPALVAVSLVMVVAAALVAPPAPVVLERLPALVADATDEDALLLGPAPVALELESEPVESVAVEESVALEVAGVLLLLVAAALVVAVEPACRWPPSALAGDAASLPPASLHAAASPSRTMLTR